jgi:hypothetical protein
MVISISKSIKTKLIFSILLLFAVAFFITDCGKQPYPLDIPACITKIIRQKQLEPETNPPTTIEQWNVDGHTYYYITSDCCDQFNNLYDEDCNYVCAPDGGITGSGDQNCPEFSLPIEKIILWTDKR